MLAPEWIAILEKFAGSGWDVIDAPSRAYLDVMDQPEARPAAAAALIAAVEVADRECGSCGCEFDPLYKQLLANRELLSA